jgi:hypothetical protein
MSWLAVLALFTARCGDPLVPDGYRGEPLFELEGQLVSLTELGPLAEGTPRVGLFWSPTGDTREAPAQLVEQRSATIDVTFPAAFKVRLFESPPPAAFAARAELAVGVLLVYLDADENGRFDPAGDRLLGGDDRGAVLFAPAALGAEASPTGRPLQAGFTYVRLPLPCAPPEALPPSGGERCGVDLGAACAVNADCGEGGLCIKDLDGWRFPGGYCVQPEGSCTPARGVLLELERDDGSRATWWFAGCVDDADCREEAGYGCDLAFSFCAPRETAAITLWDGFEVEPLCLD